MKKILSVAVVVFAGAALAQGTVPNSVNFNAHLTDSAGTPVSGPQTVQFRLYDQASGGASVWEDTQTQTFSSDGLASFELANLNPTQLDGRKLYLEVKVGATTLTPRIAIVSVPYAIRASVAATAMSVGNLQANQIQQRVTGSCANGEAMSSINADGTVGCAAASPGTVTSVASGAGLTGGPITASGTLQVDFAGSGTASTVARSDHTHSQLQQRVIGTCPNGEAMRSVNADGSVGCAAAGTGTVTSVASGSGLTGGPITASGTLQVDFAGSGTASTVSRSDHTHNQCITVSISNRVGSTWKYGRFELPFPCTPAYLSPSYPTAAPNTFGCTLEMFVEHHSGNNAGYWRGSRSANFAIFPNGEGTGQAYMEVWDYSASNVYNIQAGPGESLLGSHWYDMCRFTDSYFNGATWQQASPRTGGGWVDLGLMATGYTRCSLRICENNKNAGTASIVERTSGPLTD